MRNPFATNVMIVLIDIQFQKTKAELDAQLQEVTEERSKLNAEKQTIFIEKQRITAKYGSIL